MKTERRTTWSHAHLWIGRTVITLGMINGGLGMLFAHRNQFFVPSRSQMIAYGVVAGLMWLLWAGIAVLGEMKRSSARRAAQGPKTTGTTTEEAPKA